MAGSRWPSRGHSGRRVECGPGVCCNGLSKEPAEGSGLGRRLLPGQRVRCPSMASSGAQVAPSRLGLWQLLAVHCVIPVILFPEFLLKHSYPGDLGYVTHSL